MMSWGGRGLKGPTERWLLRVRGLSQMALLAGCLLLSSCRRDAAPAVPAQGETSREPPPPPAGPGWFVDRTGSTGVSFQCRNGEEADLPTLLESLGGGVALLDYDGDGRLDLFLVG